MHRRSTDHRLSSTGVDIPIYTSEIESSLQKKILPAVLSYFSDCATRRNLLNEEQITKLRTAMTQQYNHHLSEQLDKWEAVVTDDLLNRKEVDQFNQERKTAAHDRVVLMENVQRLTQQWIQKKQECLFDKELNSIEKDLKSRSVKLEQSAEFCEVSNKFEKLQSYFDDSERYLDRFEGLLDAKIATLKNK